jgi:hypothetical protein
MVEIPSLQPGQLVEVERDDGRWYRCRVQRLDGRSAVYVKDPLQPAPLRLTVRANEAEATRSCPARGLPAFSCPPFHGPCPQMHPRGHARSASLPPHGSHPAPSMIDVAPALTAWSAVPHPAGRVQAAPVRRDFSGAALCCRFRPLVPRRGGPTHRPSHQLHHRLATVNLGGALGLVRADRGRRP